MSVSHKVSSHVASLHHQPIDVPTAGAQAFLKDYTQGDGPKTHDAGPLPGLTYLPKHVGARDSTLLVIQ
jgi:hypothetical protein